VKASGWVVSLVAATLVASCASSEANGGSASKGADAPSAAALNYAEALGRGDIQGANALVARDRRYCPSIQSTLDQLGVPVPNRGEQLQTRVVAARHTWRVTFLASDGDGSSSSGPPWVVVREAGHYFVC
jgi:hypothetical protein